MRPRATARSGRIPGATFWLWLAVLGAALPASAADSPPFRAGAYAADITPKEFPISSNGSMTDKQMTGAHDPLHARCLVLDDGRTQLAIVVCDSCMIPRDVFDEAKRLAAAATGIPAEHMLMSATHTHTAVTATGVFQSDPVESYRQFLVRQLAAGVQQAFEQREPARIGWGTADDPSQVFNRRWFTRPGVQNEDPFGRTTDRVRMNPGYNPTNNQEPAGPVDPEVCVLSVQAVDGRPLAVLANYSLHYVGGPPGGLLSADYFGEFATRIAERLGAADVQPPFVGIMSNGTSANINNSDYSRERSVRREPFEQIRVVAASVADAAYRAVQGCEYWDWVPLDAEIEELELGIRLPSPEDVTQAKTWLAEAGPPPYSERKHIYARETVLLAHYPPRARVLLQALRIGESAIVSSPCETFVETGLAVKEQSPFKMTFTIELANGYNGYLPTPEHHDLGGYETWRARSSYLARDAEPQIRRTQLELLRRLQSAAAP
jgi:hypothetical protein